MKKTSRFGTRSIACAAALALAAGGLAGLGGLVRSEDAVKASAASDPDYYYYESDYSNAQAVRDAAIALNREIEAEGMVLLKNDGLLPMKGESGAKLNVSVFGKSTAAIAYFGYGSSDSMAIGGEWTRQSKPFYDAFNNSAFNINPTLKAFYQDDARSGSGRIDGNHSSADNNYHGSLDAFRAGLPTGETPWSSYTQEVKDSFADYHDAAIVMLTRVRGEGSDLPKTSLSSWGGSKLAGARSGEDHYLQLDANEVKLLQEVMNEFENVVLLINASGPMEVGFLNDPTHYLYTDNDYTSSTEEATAKMNRIRAAVTVGFPGTDGCYEIPRLLSGEITPSGHLADTWVYDMKKDPTWQNQGSNGSANGNVNGAPFVHYDEDIFLGYRYYETRYFEEGRENLDDGEAWYRGQVQYPFGYGLSYTTFEWSDVSFKTSTAGNSLTKDGKVTARVRVTNTGEASGKEVVQLYYSAPYYQGGISKAHVVLGGFAKTGLLEPGDSETLTLTMDVSDMRSYDWSDADGDGYKGYVLEAGDYTFVLATDAHDAAQRAALATKEEPGEHSAVWTLGDLIRYETDPVTGSPVVSLFDDVSGTGRTNDGETFQGVRQYMLRDDFEGTFPTPASEKMNGMKQTTASFDISEEFDAGKPWYTDKYPTQAEVAGTSDTNTIKLWHLRGRDYDDPLWDAFLDQLTVHELVTLVQNGFFGTVSIPSVGKPNTYDDDGPLGKRHTPDVQWADNTTLAQTFNADLAYRQGVMQGEAALWGANHVDNSDLMSPPGGRDNTKPEGRGGTYGLGLDTHRSPFGGRNFEYFSEDGVLAGKLAAQVSKGSLSKGLYQISKHVMLNDQETNRGSLSTWASEQAIREIYGKPFEIAIKEGGLMAMMAGVNCVGNVPCSENWAVLTGLCRNEWGFRGFVITDLVYMPVNMCIRAGCNTMMVHQQNNPPSTDSGSLTPTQLSVIRESAKCVLYTCANSNGIQGYGGPQLSGIEYGGANTLYAVEGVSNDLSTNTARVTFTGAETVYSVHEGTELPAGMTLDEKGRLTGAPERAGDYTVTLDANENISGNSAIAYPYKTATKSFRLKVFAKDEIPDTILFEDASVPTIPVGYPFEQSIRSAVVFDTEGRLTTDITYALTEHSALPEGLSLEDGVIKGICTAPDGKYFFTVRASAEGRKSVDLDFIVRVKEYAIDYPVRELDAMHVGEAVSLSLADATNADGLEIEYRLKEGSTLPEGLSMNRYGQLTGTPTRAVTDYTFTVVATAERAKPAEAEYRVTVLGIEMADATFGDVLLGKNYLFRLNAAPNDGGSAAVTFRVKEGSALPAGFALASDGVLVGAATEIGEQSFTVIVEAEGYRTVEAEVTLDVYGIFEAPVTSDIDGTPIDPSALTPAKADHTALIAGCISGGVVVAAAAIVAAVLITKKKKGDQK